MFILLKWQYLGRINNFLLMPFLYYYISYITPAFIVIPVIIGILKYGQFTAPFKVLFWFVVFSAVANAANIILIQCHFQTPIMFHLYTPVEFACMSLFYNYLFNKRWQKILIALILVFVLFCVVDILYVQNSTQIDTYPGTVEAIIIIGYSVLYLNQQSNIEHESSWESSGLNWANIAILIYYGCGLFMFIATNYLMKASLNVNLIVWSVFDTILVVEYLLFAIGFYKCKT